MCQHIIGQLDTAILRLLSKISPRWRWSWKLNTCCFLATKSLNKITNKTVSFCSFFLLQLLTSLYRRRGVDLLHWRASSKSLSSDLRRPLQSRFLLQKFFNKMENGDALLSKTCGKQFWCRKKEQNSAISSGNRIQPKKQHVLSFQLHRHLSEFLNSGLKMAVSSCQMMFWHIKCIAHVHNVMKYHNARYTIHHR